MVMTVRDGSSALQTRNMNDRLPTYLDAFRYPFRPCLETGVSTRQPSCWTPSSSHFLAIEVHFSFLLEGKDSQTKTETIVMSHIFAKLTPMLLFPAFCTAQPLTASEALDRYLARSRDGQSECSGLVLAVQIDASLPHLKKQGTMSGFRQVSGTGRIAYRDLQFTGDNVIKTHVIARFIANDTAPPEGKASANVTRENYSFVFESTSDYNGLSAFVFRLQPRRKRAGFFQG